MEQQQQRPVEEMRQEVARLRNQGLSFSQVAKELGISKSYSVKLSKSQSDRSLQPVTGHLGLSVRQRKFAKGLLEGKTQKDAALDANVPPASAETWASKEVRTPKFLNESRQRAVDSGWDLYGRHKPEQTEQPQGPTIIYITQEKKKAIEGMIGGPLEDGPNVKVIDVRPQEPDEAVPTALND